MEAQGSQMGSPVRQDDGHTIRSRKGGCGRLHSLSRGLPSAHFKFQLRGAAVDSITSLNLTDSMTAEQEYDLKQATSSLYAGEYDFQQPD